jgi:hypothetical protein
MYIPTQTLYDSTPFARRLLGDLVSLYNSELASNRRLIDVVGRSWYTYSCWGWTQEVASTSSSPTSSEFMTSACRQRRALTAGFSNAKMREYTSIFLDSGYKVFYRLTCICKFWTYLPHRSKLPGMQSLKFPILSRKTLHHGE